MAAASLLAFLAAAAFRLRRFLRRTMTLIKMLIATRTATRTDMAMTSGTA